MPTSVYLSYSSFIVGSKSSPLSSFSKANLSSTRCMSTLSWMTLPNMSSFIQTTNLRILKTPQGIVYIWQTKCGTFYLVNFRRFLLPSMIPLSFAFPILATFAHYRNEGQVLLGPQYLTLNEFEWSAITRECCFRWRGEFCFITCMLETAKALNYSDIIRDHEDFPL